MVKEFINARDCFCAKTFIADALRGCLMFKNLIVFICKINQLYCLNDIFNKLKLENKFKILFG